MLKNKERKKSKNREVKYIVSSKKFLKNLEKNLKFSELSYDYISNIFYYTDSFTKNYSAREHKP